MLHGSANYERDIMLTDAPIFFFFFFFLSLFTLYIAHSTICLFHIFTILHCSTLLWTRFSKLYCVAVLQLISLYLSLFSGWYAFHCNFPSFPVLCQVIVSYLNAQSVRSIAQCDSSLHSSVVHRSSLIAAYLISYTLQIPRNCTLV